MTWIEHLDMFYLDLHLMHDSRVFKMQLDLVDVKMIGWIDQNRRNAHVGVINWMMVWLAPTRHAGKCAHFPRSECMSVCVTDVRNCLFVIANWSACVAPQKYVHGCLRFERFFSWTNPCIIDRLMNFVYILSVLSRRSYVYLIQSLADAFLWADIFLCADTLLCAKP